MTDIQSLTHARVLRIAIPIVLANMTIPLQGLVDTAVIGQIPSATPLAAVGLGAAVLGALLWIFGFLRMGTAGLTAQAFGAGDSDEVAALLSRALLIGFAGGLLLIPLLPLVLTYGFGVSAASEAVKAQAAEYMSIRIWAAPAAVAVFGINGWLGAQEKTRAMLALQLAQVAVNVVLSITLVVGFEMGVRGVAFATLIADLTGAAFGLWLCRSAFAGSAWKSRARILDPARLKVMTVVNTDILLRSLMLQAIFLSFIFYYSALFGDEVLAANHILMQFISVMAYALDGFAFAAEALVGQAFGARAVTALRRAVWLTSLWGFASNFAFALVFALGGGPIINSLTADAEVRSAAHSFLPWIVAAPLIGLPSWMLDGIFIGATRTRDMRNMMAISLALSFVAVSLLVPWFGAHGLWAALMVSFIVRAVTLGLRYPALERAASARASG